MVFGGMAVKWNGTGGEISQGTCKVSVVAVWGCVTSFSLQNLLGKGGWGVRVQAQYLRDAGSASGKDQREMVNWQICFISASHKKQSQPQLPSNDLFCDRTEFLLIYPSSQRCLFLLTF